MSATFDEYWLGYLSGHSRLSTRIFHYFGLFFGQLIGIAIAIFFAWWVIFIINPLSYIVAYISHEHIEGNSNKPFASRPLWSVISFFRMLLLDMTGGLQKEFSRLP